MLPLDVNRSGPLPVYAYLAEGGLGSSPASVGGTAQYPSATYHGVVGDPRATGRDAYPVDQYHPAGSTWVRAEQAGGADATTTFYDALGRPFRVERTGPASAPTEGIPAVATTRYDANGRVDKTVDFDGTTTLYLYDAKDGLADVVLDVDRDGAYTPLVDRKTTERYTAANPTAGAQGTATKVLADAGVARSTTTAENNGLKVTGVDDGRTSTGEVTYDPETGEQLVTATAPDGTRTVRTSKQGLLLKTETFGPAGAAGSGTPVTSESYQYDALGRLWRATDPAWGSTTYDRLADGTVSKVTYPDGRTTVYADFDDKTNAPPASTRPDQGQQAQSLNAFGQTETLDGAGVITQRLGYDALTGQLTGLTTFRSGTLDDASPIV